MEFDVNLLEHNAFVIMPPDLNSWDQNEHFQYRRAGFLPVDREIGSFISIFYSYNLYFHFNFIFISWIFLILVIKTSVNEYLTQYIDHFLI